MGKTWLKKLGWDQSPPRSSGTGREIPLPGARGISQGATPPSKTRQRPNSMRTSRYTIWNFLPLQLVYQFSRLAHFYLLVVSILQLIPGLSTTGKLTTVIPLLIFLVLIIAKEGYYDYKRHRADVAENQRRALVMAQVDHSSRWEWVEIQWQHIDVGDIVRLKKDEEVPADLVLLHASHEGGVTYVDTMALDGETSLKRKQPPTGLSGCYNIDKISEKKETIVIEDPHADLYRFDGTVVGAGATVPFGIEEVIYRGSTVRNTTETIGVVALTGEECRVRMNSKNGLKPKKPALERTTNYIVVCLMFYVLLLSGLCTIAYFFWARPNESRAWYLSGASVSFEEIFLGFIIMFNQVIPLSLYIGLEAIKLGQTALITGDLHLYHSESDTPASVNSNNVLDDLGQISYVFTDKTGTLTENIMSLRRFYIHGTSWLHQSNSEKHNGRQETRSFGTAALSQDTECMLKYVRAQPASRWSLKAIRYLTATALCHACFPVSMEDGGVEYQGSSPDEVALVQAAKELGFAVVSKSSRAITLNMPDGSGQGKLQHFEILDVIDFSSDRKRMSVIFRCPDGEIWLICKGADTVMFPRIIDTPESFFSSQACFTTGGGFNRPNSLDDYSNVYNIAGVETDDDSIPLCGMSTRETPYERPQTIAYMDDIAQRLGHAALLSEPKSITQCRQHIDMYAAEGLRTLVYADRNLTHDEYQSWKRDFAEAQTALVNRQERIADSGEQIEQSLTLLGASAVEDKLQKNVPETIESLRRANIKICMLTGDKRETAINIARSSRICVTDTVIHELDVDREDSIEVQLESVAEKLKSRHRSQCSSTAILVDGRTLTEIEQPSATSMRRLFYELISQVDSIICCRASPSQKALLVSSVSNGPSINGGSSIFKRMMNWFTSPRKPLTLAIGDGANDVAMLLTANVGIGISGREGQQAARVADVSISQFRFLARLMLVHGRHNYHRTTMFILTTFWKEIFIYFPQALFQDKVGVTGTSLYYPPSLVFVSFLTAVSMVVIGTWEQDLDANTLLAVPELYVYGQRGESMSLRVFMGWVANALFAGLVIFQVPWLGYTSSEIVNEPGLFAQGELIFIASIIWINCKILLLEMHCKTKIAIWSAVLSVAGLWVYELITSLVTGATAGPYAVKSGLTNVFGRDALWWMCLIWALGFLVFFEIALRAWKQNSLMRSVVAFCLPFLNRGDGGGVRRGFNDWEPRLWQEFEKDPAVVRRLKVMGEKLF